MGVFPQRDPRVQSTSRMRAQGPGTCSGSQALPPSTPHPHLSLNLQAGAPEEHPYWARKPGV